MRINKNENRKYLVDRSRLHAPIGLGPISLETELELQGYDYEGLGRTESVIVLLSTLEKDFDPIENLERLYYKTEGFFTFLPWWYHKSMDCYFKMGPPKMRKGFSEESCLIIAVMYNNDKVRELKDFLNQNRLMKNYTENTIEIVVEKTGGQPEFQAHELIPSDICVETMYNDDFKPVYEHVIKKLNQSGKGVVLFHGLAGAGKTHLIKHLTTRVDKRFIFLPVQMINQLTNPSFMPMLLRRPNSVLVLEDCENYIEDRSLGRSGSVVSSLLQITDGILSDLLNLQVICTFNTALTRIDAALLREGRLIAEYEFKELEEKKWAQFTNNRMLNGKRTLANAFNTLTLRNEQPEKRAIGF